MKENIQNPEESLDDLDSQTQLIVVSRLRNLLRRYGFSDSEIRSMSNQELMETTNNTPLLAQKLTIKETKEKLKELNN